MLFPTEWTLEPLIGASQVRLGMTLKEVVQILGPLDEPLTPMWGSKSQFGGWHKNAFAVHFSPRAEYISISRGVGLSASLLGVDVFNTPASDVVAALVALGHQFDEDDPELGHTYVFPAIQVDLWRPVTPESEDDVEGRYFDTVGIGAQGYWGS